MKDAKQNWTYDKKLQCYVCTACGVEVVWEDGSGRCACTDEDWLAWEDFKRDSIEYVD